MILADTSVWINHLARKNPVMAARLEWDQIVCHPAVIGELACGTFRGRRDVLDLLRYLPQIMEAQHDEVLMLIENKQLMGTGIGWIDAHLLASALLGGAALWTFDKRLAAAAEQLEVQATL